MSGIKTNIKDLGKSFNKWKYQLDKPKTNEDEKPNGLFTFVRSSVLPCVPASATGIDQGKGTIHP